MTNTMAKRSTHDDNKAPGQVGRTDFGYENLQVKLLHWPKEDEFKVLMTKAANAVKGSILEDVQIDEIMVEDLFKGGLNQSLEWFTVVFEVSGVTRGVTHQLVRTRKASFAQQSMRYADMGNFNARMPVGIVTGKQIGDLPREKYPLLRRLLGELEAFPDEIWTTAINVAREAYAWLADNDIPMQDARTVCPIATETYIICEYPLNEFLNLYSYRACQMFYPEMVALMGLMRTALLEKCPWLEPHLKISCEKTGPGITVDTGIGPYQLAHRCTYQGFERVEGQCKLDWAVEENRIYKSRKVSA